MKNVPIKGIIPPIVTPMSADESVNIPELRNQIERQIAGGVHGIFPFGTNGEGYILSMKEKEEVLEATIDQVKGRIPVYAGTGCISTRDTIYMSKRAEEMGADVLSIITPSFALASQKELYDHYSEVAKHVSIPIVLYNIPARTGNKLLPETVGKLARDVDVIMGAKDSSGDIENLKAYIRETRDIGKDFAVPFVAEGCVSAWAQYAILAKDTQTRDRVIAHLKEKNIPNMIYYPTPQHALPVFKAEPHYGETYANANDYCARTLSLPMHPYMDAAQQQTVIDAVREAL